MAVKDNHYRWLLGLAGDQATHTHAAYPLHGCGSRTASPGVPLVADGRAPDSVVISLYMWRDIYLYTVNITDIHHRPRVASQFQSIHVRKRVCVGFQASTVPLTVPPRTCASAGLPRPINISASTRYERFIAYDPPVNRARRFSAPSPSIDDVHHV